MPDGTYVLADLPRGINSHFGNELKRYILYQNYVNNVSQVKIKQELNEIGIEISEGQINNIILNASEMLKKEYMDIGRVGITTAYELYVDDTGNRHNGENGNTLAVLNKFFSFFVSSNSKSRIQFLKTLLCGNTDYMLKNISFDFLKRYKLTEEIKYKLLQLKDINFANKLDWNNALIKSGITPMVAGKQLLIHIEEAGMLGSLINHGVSPNLVIVSDGASSFNVFNHGNCWMHAERAIKKLTPIDEIDIVEIEKVQDDIWNFYNQLKNYKKNPNDIDKVIISKKFDEIFTQTVTSMKLTAALKKFRMKKDDLLRVLDYPFIDTHNNSSELDIRSMVIKNNISGQTRSEDGRNARDSLLSITKTCKKLGISIREFLIDRLNGTNKIPYLPDLIRQRAESFLMAPP